MDTENLFTPQERAIPRDSESTNGAQSETGTGRWIVMFRIRETGGKGKAKCRRAIPTRQLSRRL